MTRRVTGSPLLRTLLLAAVICLMAGVAAQRKFDGQQPVRFTPPVQDVETVRILPAASKDVKSTLLDETERHGVFYPPGPPQYPGPGGPGGGQGSWPLSSMTLELTPGSRLTVRPGESARLSYEVMNLRDTPQPVAFSAADTLGLVRAVLPPRVLVPPRGVSRVTVELFPTREGSEGLVNTVTLAGQSADGSLVSRSALVRVTSEKEDADGWSPHCSFSVPWGQCRDTGVTSACGSAGWNAEVTVRDDLSGLLRVESSPPGNLMPPRYTAGTRAPVTLLMAASCCQESMQIRVWDAQGNTRTCEANVYGLTPVEIVAIVLGVLLLLLLLVLVVLACLLCRRRRKETLSRRELPVHRG